MDPHVAILLGAVRQGLLREPPPQEGSEEQARILKAAAALANTPAGVERVSDFAEFGTECLRLLPAAMRRAAENGKE